MASGEALPGPADVEYFAAAQAGAWGDMLRSFVRFVGRGEGERALDAGAGPGLLPRLFFEAGVYGLVVGVDDSLPMLNRAVRLAAEPTGSTGHGHAPGLTWTAADVHRLPFADGAFDVVTATNLLFLLPSPAEGLRELVRTARQGGTLAFLNPTAAMSIAAAEAFMDVRGVTGFARFSFVNYARLAEAHLRLSGQDWLALAADAGLSNLRADERAGGMVVFVAGKKGQAYRE